MNIICLLPILTGLLFSGVGYAAVDRSEDYLRLEPRVPAYMTQTLRREVDALRSDIAANPTSTPEEAAARVHVFWRWLNAYALSGRPIYPDLPQVVARLVQQGLPQRGVDQFAPYMDLYAREFSFRDAYPDAVQVLQTDFLGPYSADAYAPIKQTYTIGSMPIGPGGGFAVATRSYAGALAIQTEDPSGDGYVTIESSNDEVEFEVDQVEMAGMFSGSLGGREFRPYFRVASGILEPGDVVTIIAGDTRSGGRGLKLPSQSSSALRVRVFVSFSSKHELFSLAELPFHSEGLTATGTRGFAPSIVKVNEPAVLTVRLEDRFRNRATRGLKPLKVLDGDRVVRSFDTPRAFHEFELTFDKPGVHYLRVETSDGSLKGEFNPILVEEAPEQRIYWGETHGHTGFAEGAGTVDNFFRFAREDARLDFMSLSEHDLWMDDYEFEVLRKQAIAANDPGRFVTFLGYEFTVQPTLGGHHNVLFRTPEGRRRVERQRAPEQSLMLSMLRAENDIDDVLVIPHAHNPGRWWSTDPGLERQVEIVSNHGTFEWLGQRFLEQGTHVGFIGGSDDHLGHPGIRSLSSERSGSDNFGGMAAVLSPSLFRDPIFDALRERRTYATNGQKIILQMTANDRGMGETISASQKIDIEGRVIGTGAIWQIDLVRNGETINSIEYQGGSSRPTGTLDIRFDSESDPKVRNKHSRKWRVWRGHIDVVGAKVEGLATPNTENLYTEYARMSQQKPNRVEFFIRTRGAPKSIELQLSEISQEAAIDVSAKSGRDGRLVAKVPLHNLHANGKLIEAPSGPHMDTFQVRWVEPSRARDRRFSFDLGQVEKDDTFYIRVLQRNGGMAWSSPVKVLAAE